MSPVPTVSHPLSIPPWWAGPFTRSILNEALSKMPHIPLYHYTTQTGLLGIIGKREIWATHTQYLNDTREFHHALSVFREELQDLTNECRQQDRSICFDEMKGGISDSLASTNVCVASFSEAGDSLSQWRAYGGSAGFAIGFPGEFLAGIVRSERFHFYLAPCVYDAATQRRIARALLDEVADKNLVWPRSQDGEYEGLPSGGYLIAYLFRFAPLFKHHSFADEREWRIISSPLPCGLQEFEFRPGASQITPYFRFPLTDESTVFRVSDVVVGPTPHTESALQSVKSFLIKHELNDTVVRKSEVPYRSW
jgi:hypothetical protein